MKKTQKILANGRNSVYSRGVMRGIARPIRLRARARSSCHRRAATLIELLVVIAMIGLLISILIPSLKQSMDLASKTLCMHSLREIGYGLRLYRQDNDGWLPVPQRLGAEDEAVRPIEPWFGKLYPTYLDNMQIVVCPDDPFGYRLANTDSRLTDPGVADYPSYGLNSFVVTSGNGYLADLDRYQPTRPHDTILVADLGPDDTLGGSQVAGVAGPVRNAGLLAWDDGFDPFQDRFSGPWVTRRHDPGINVLALPGEVREARTAHMMGRPLLPYYENCAAGGCTFCKELRLPHYSFARDHLYWWTGPVPAE